MSLYNGQNNQSYFYTLCRLDGLKIIPQSAAQHLAVWCT